MGQFDRRRKNLLAAAARTFAARGYDRTTMREFAKATRMSLAGMYYYVKGKEDLLFEFQKGCFERVRRGAEQADIFKESDWIAPKKSDSMDG